MIACAEGRMERSAKGGDASLHHSMYRSKWLSLPLTVQVGPLAVSRGKRRGAAVNF